MSTFSLDLFLPSLFLKKGVSGALNKGHTQKRSGARKREAGAGDSSISRSWSPSPWEGTPLPPHSPTPHPAPGEELVSKI